MSVFKTPIYFTQYVTHYMTLLRRLTFVESYLVPRQRFFFPRENQKCAWNVFLAFFWLFSRTKNRFHAHFFATFHVQSKFFTGIFLDFSRIEFYFHGEIFEKFHVQLSFFTHKKYQESQAKWEQTSNRCVNLTRPPPQSLPRNTDIQSRFIFLACVIGVFWLLGWS